jgi:hypothetical protein
MRRPRQASRTRGDCNSPKVINVTVRAEYSSEVLIVCGCFQIFSGNARTIATWAFDSVARSRFCQAFASILANAAYLRQSAFGALTSLGKTGTRTTVGLPGSGLSYTHLEKAHHDSPNAALPAEPAIPHGKAWRGWLWIALLVFLIVVATRH